MKYDSWQWAASSYARSRQGKQSYQIAQRYRASSSHVSTEHNATFGCEGIWIDERFDLMRSTWARKSIFVAKTKVLKPRLQTWRSQITLSSSE
jgi:hypothetical protein